MAKTYKITDDATITIKNVAEAEVLKDAYTGERAELTLADAKKAGYTQFEYALNANGDFVLSDTEKFAKADGSNVVVVVRQAVKNTDRFVQFFRTQQKIKLAVGDSIEIPIKTAAEAAYYLQFNDNGLTATASAGVVTEA